MIGTVKRISSVERTAHKVVIEALKPHIDNTGLEIASYDVNPINLNLEIVIDSPVRGRRMVVALSKDGKIYEVFEYHQSVDQTIADVWYEGRVKNAPMSRRLVESVNRLF